MRVGIVTFHCSYNFGSALQAWALYRKLESLGHEVEIVDYRGRDFRQYKLIRVARPRTVMQNLLSLRRNLARRRSFESFLSDNMDSTTRYAVRTEGRMSELCSMFDCFVCGSDQIWNLDCTGGPVRPYFLSFAEDRRRVAYAPSLAHVSFKPENFTERDKEFIGEQLDRFSAISVRETSTVGLFQPLTRNRIEVCLDPTLLLDGEDYRSIAADVPVEEPFVFAYMLEENPAVMAQAERVAREADAMVAYVSKSDRHLSVPSVNLYGIGPSEFLGLVSGAEAVVTNSFHATVFSLLLGTPFQTIATRDSGSRMRELLTSLGETSHLIEGMSDVMPSAADQAALAPKLDVLRAHSLAFLKRALEG